MQEVQYKEHSDFRRSLLTLEKYGGNYQKASEIVYSVLGRLSEDSDPFHKLKTTNNGETRIKKCIKYDLPGFTRLIVVNNKGVCLLCFVGKHDDCDKWLDRNTGLTLTAKNQRITPTILPASPGSEYHYIQPEGVATTKKLMSLLPSPYQDTINKQLNFSQKKMLQEFDAFSSDDDINGFLNELSESNSELSNCIFNCMNHLAKDDVDNACRVIDLHTKIARSIDDLSIQEIRRLEDSDKIRSIPSDSKAYAKLLKYHSENMNYKEWMLYMHPEQEAVAYEEFSGSAKLLGVSGSGKTCIVVKRAIYLADKYPNEKILVLTLNPPLAAMINELVSSCSRTSYEDRIIVKPLFEELKDLLIKFEPASKKIYNNISWKGNEHIDEIWHEFYRCDLNNYDARVIQPLHDSLISRGVYAEQYLRDEFDWVRSALPPAQRDSYQSIERKGRSYPLDKKFRNQILEGLKYWKKKMSAVGVIDHLGAASALYNHIEKITPQYRSILIDESQDIGTTELSIVRKLVQVADNDIFLCGDAAQQVSTKFQSLEKAGISITRSNTRQVTKNYRNSRDILDASYNILMNNLSVEMLEGEDFEVLDPEFANFSGKTPLILEAESIEVEIAYAIELAKQEVAENPERKACIAFCGFSLYEIVAFGKKVGIEVLDGGLSIGNSSIFLSDLEQTKGFEFDLICIVNCNETVIPNPYLPESETFRDLARFYVAMTRSKSQLILSYSENKSKYLEGVDDHFLEEPWHHFHPGTPTLLGKPERLHNINYEGNIPDDYSLMTGEQFLYSFKAIGLDGSLIKKIRELVDGKGLKSGKDQVKWAQYGKSSL